MKSVIRLCLLALLTGVLFGGRPLYAAQLQWSNKEFMGTDEIKTGMTGYGKTVFQGVKIDTFRFVVLGVMRYDLDDDIIMVRLTSGPCVTKKWHVIAGMSGSPMYINGRMIGALAYGYPFAMEAIGGVMPIKRMMDSYEPGCAVRPPARSAHPLRGELHLGGQTINQVRLAENPSEAKSWQHLANSATLVMAPIATPVSVTGFSETETAALQKVMEPYNISIVANAAGGHYIDEKAIGGPVTLEPGAAVSVAMTDGDSQFMATGTVTYRKGNIILAFGHPFSGLGDCSFGMYTTYIHGILATTQMSSKMPAPIKRVGAFTRDHYHCIGGVIGQDPGMIPLDLHLHNTVSGYDQHFHIEVAVMHLLTEKWMMLMALWRPFAELGGIYPELDLGCYDMHATFSTREHGVIEQRLTNSSRIGGDQYPSIEIILMLQTLLESQYEPIKLNKLDLDVAYTPNDNRVGRIEQVTPDRLSARPGETIMLNVRLLRYGVPAETRVIPIRVPERTGASMMTVAVLGGAEVNLTRQVLAPFPNRSEGAGGLIRFLSGQLSARRIVVAEMLPTPSYNLDGHSLANLPAPLADVLPLNDYGKAFGINPWLEVVDYAGTLADSGYGGVYINLPTLNYPRLSPTIHTSCIDDPLLLAGGQMVTIAIDNGTDPPGSGSMLFNPQSLPGNVPAPVPQLTTSQPTPKVTATLLDMYAAALGQTPADRQSTLDFLNILHLPSGAVNPLTLPVLNCPFSGSPLPLSCAPSIPYPVQTTPAIPIPTKADAPANLPATPAPPASPEASPLLAAKQPACELSEAKDFARGTHFGTAVSSSGKLTLIPSVRSLYQSDTLVPWKTVAFGDNIYLGGWHSAQVIAVHSDGQHTVLFPQTVTDAGLAKAISALAIDKDGNLLIAGWPDHTVRLVTPAGTVQASWSVPCGTIWDLTVTSDQRLLAGGDNGVLYQLNKDNHNSVSVACSVPDQHIYALVHDTSGGVYLATAPRGKIYYYSSAAQLTARYEASGTTMTAVSSLALDDAGNLYAGLSPSCSVLRIAKNGSVQTIMSGAGKDNKDVLALAMHGNDLYAATGPAGGIYRISSPATTSPEVTIIYARHDERSSDEQDAGAGPESLAVTSLTFGKDDRLYAATAVPAQLLQLSPRNEGIFISPPMKAPTVAQWGAVEIQSNDGSRANYRVDSRSGLTATPDSTWGTWETVSQGARVHSDPATYLQLRIHVTNDQGMPLVQRLRLTYQTASQPPTAKFTDPAPGAAFSGSKEIKWESSDTDGDVLDDALFLSADGGHSWKSLTDSAPATPTTSAVTVTAPIPATPLAPATTNASKEPEKPAVKIANKSFHWDTKTVADGQYLLKLVSSTVFAHPADPKSAEAVISVIVNNTPPTVAVDDTVQGLEKVARLQLTDALSPIIAGAYRLDDNPWVALVPEEGLYGNKQLWVKLIIPAGRFTLVPGEHKLTLQAKDAAGNLMQRTIKLVIQ